MLTLFKKTLSFIDRSTRLTALGVAALMVIGAFLEAIGVGLVFPLVKAISEPEVLSNHPWALRVFGPVTEENRQSVLVLLAFGFFAVIAIKNAFLLLIFVVQGRFLARNEALLANRLFAHYLLGEYRLHLTRNSTTLINNVITAAASIYSHTVRGFMTIGIEIFMILMLTGILLIADPFMTIGALLLMLCGIGVFYGAIRQRMAAWGQQAIDTRQKVMQLLQQGLHSLKEIKVLGREAFILEGFDAVRQEMAAVEARMFIAGNAPRLWIETLVIGGAMLAIIYIVLQDTSTSDLFSVLALFAAAAFRLIPSTNRILMAMNSVRGGGYSVDVIYDDMRAFQRPDTAIGRGNGDKLAFKDTLVLEKVSFTYPESSATAVTGIDLTVRKGESVGLVGLSGAGKTTLVDIILGLLPPQSGRILVDGKDVADNLPAWQDNLSYVPQSVYLLDDTLRRNIAFGLRDDEIDEDKVWNALRLVQLEDFVRALPDGLDTSVREHGDRLSGGQRQRVGIARALYFDPDVLIFDEATSFLDSETEHEVNNAVERLSGKKTVIIIAHRLSTVRNCDRLVFLDDGSVNDIGTFDALATRNKAFKNMVELSKL